MKRWLMITTVDVLARANNREHQLLARLSHRFENTTVVFRRGGSYGPLWKRIADALIPSVQVTCRDGVRYVAVNPPLNHYEGMVREMIQRGRERSGGERTLGQMVRLAAGPIGILKDLSTIASLAIAAAFYGKGADTFCTALGPWAAAAARMLSKTGHIGSWIYEDRDFEPGFISSPLRQRWAAWMERSGVLAAPATVCIGRRLKTLRHTTTGRRPFLIPTGADCSANPLARRSRDPVLVYIGNVATWAGLSEVVRALPEIRKAVSEVRLMVLGDGAPMVLNGLRQTIAQAGVEDAVELLPGVPHPQVAAQLMKCSIGLAVFEPTPLRVYAMPLKVVEYMAAGLPVLATAGTESADVVTNYNCGLAINLDRTEISTAVTRLLSDMNYWKIKSDNSISAASDFEWSEISENEWEIMRHVAASRGKVDADIAYEGWKGPASIQLGRQAIQWDVAR